MTDATDANHESHVTLEQIQAVTGGVLTGTPNVAPTRLLDPAHPAYRQAAAQAVVVLAPGAEPPEPAPALLVVAEKHELAADYGGAHLRVADPRLALARLSKLYDAQPLPREHQGAAVAVHPTATLEEGVVLAPGAVVDAGAHVGRNTVVGANSVVGAGVRLGAECVLHPNVTLYPATVLGDRVIIHAGAVIGADGFGYASGPRGAEKIYHSGGVVLGDDVEVGANTAIDRGTLLPTRVGARTKIDNHCQIGHNVTIGSDSLLAGMTAVAGSAVIGSGVIMGGNVAVSDHVSVGDGARIAGRAGITKDVPAGATWAGFPARPHRAFVRELYLLGKLEQIWQAVKPQRGGEGSE
jgi:UDP-3-O-[3-hydroxymyristoyl] glucosamine N-acyltransferase